ncbi:HRDC domain-containing protein [uncultured Corynebacterium sp.]|uniref:HRDC domain-containing protein n=1 Tax=uncultured Corynebacterium sp. TaxID=159447 RepID=UPI0025F911A8|nr:HRDC domain-containing protein [uncultured Corynebacterium sp.]
MCAALLTPRDGTPEVLVTEDDIADAARLIASGTGPVAVDTERASAYRYDDRAFLIQIRREGAGTILVDPETVPGVVGAAGLPEALNDLDWVVHAAVSDLPCLADLGLYPATLVDTEIAGRLLGLPKVNLAAMTERLLDVELAKGHGREDWSTRPLPRAWLDYAALDVELLNELAEALVTALAELDRVDWLRQESEAVRRAHAPGNRRGADGERWRSMRGVGKLRRPEQLVVGRELWLERDRLARERDVSPVSVLPHDVLTAIAEKPPRDERALASVKGFPRRRRGAAAQWLKVVRRALDLPRDQWPSRPRSTGPSRPHHRTWADREPRAAATLESLKLGHELLAEDLAIAPETLFRPSDLREVAWIMSGSDAAPAPTTDDEVRELLARLGARPWQIDVMAGLVSEAVLLPRRQPLG